VNGNPILKLPDGFGSLANILELHLDETGLTHLPDSFGDMATLRLLDMGKFQNIPANVASHTFIYYSESWITRTAGDHQKV